LKYGGFPVEGGTPLAHADAGGADQMLKIAMLEQSRERATLHLEGVVTGPWVEEVRTSCRAALAGSRKLTLDLAGVSFLSREAVSLIHALMAQGVQVRNCSAFVAAELNASNARPGA
jgi:hypothetical protein